VIPILYVSAVIPVTTVVPEKNATKSVNLLVVAAVVVVRVVKEEREEKVATTVDLLVATTAAAADSVATMEERVEKVEKEERVDTTVAVVDTKFVNSSVNWFMTNIRRASSVVISSIRVEQDVIQQFTKRTSECLYGRFSTNLFFHCFCRYD